MNTDGKVGIGTLNPDASSKVTIEGNSTSFRRVGATDPSMWVQLSSSYLTLVPDPFIGSSLGDFVCTWDAGYIDDLYNINIETNYILSNIVECYELIEYSDKKIKKNISSLPDFSSQLMQLNPVSFQYVDSIEIIKGNKKYYNKLPQNVKYGFLAQELQEVFPNMVSTNEKNGLLRIKPLDLIAVLVQGFQEQQKRIEILESEISKIKGNNISSKSGTMFGAIDNSNSEEFENILAQNIPNPFTENTKIPYTVNKDVRNAVMYIFDMNGKMLHTYPLEAGKGELEIHGSSYQPGMYIYALVCDGKEIDTKRMILTK